MLQKFKSDKLLAVIAILGILLFFIVSYFIMSSSRSVQAIVLNSDMDAGTIITEDMIQTINVPEKTPTGYLRNPSSVVGYKLKTAAKAGQLLYESNFMSSWTNYADSDKIPKDYVITSLCVPDEQACGGVITAGDYVDIMLVSKYQQENTWMSKSQQVTAKEINGTGRSDTGTTVTYVLANVYVLNTNSSLAESQDSDLSVAQGGSGENVKDVDGSFYIFALSYDDAKKLRQAEGSEGELWINISPNQNQEEGASPLLKQMVGNSYSFLHDAQEPVQDADGKMLVDEYYTAGDSGKMEDTSAYIDESEDKDKPKDSDNKKSGNSD